MEESNNVKPTINKILGLMLKQNILILVMLLVIALLTVLVLLLEQEVFKFEHQQRDLWTSQAKWDTSANGELSNIKK